MLEGRGYEAMTVAGDDPVTVHQHLAAVLDRALDRIHAIQSEARARGAERIAQRPRWPVVVLRTPNGWTGPVSVNGTAVEGTFRAHQVPLPNARSDSGERALLENWLRSYHPDELFDDEGRFALELARLAPAGDRRMGANPRANGGRVPTALDLPDFSHYAVPVPAPAVTRGESTRQLGELLRDTFTRNRAAADFRLLSPDETNSIV